MKYSIGTFYNRISFLYPVIDFFLKAHRKAMINQVNDEAPGKLLEIGFGNGSHLPLYTRHQVTGIEISAVMLRKASRFENQRVSLFIMNGESLVFPESTFDYVVISHVLAVTKDPDQLLNEVFKVLKPGGKLFILNHFTPDNWLRYVDRAFQPFSTLLHFKSLFYPEDLKVPERFSLIHQSEKGIGRYYKLLIFCRS
jgi:phosphatidylethanolamine/phosphatidyl-N-methylethanolamine N-methyltransferase